LRKAYVYINELVSYPNTSLQSEVLGYRLLRMLYEPGREFSLISATETHIRALSAHDLVYVCEYGVKKAPLQGIMLA